MAGRSRYVPRNKGFAELAVSPKAYDAVLQAAEKAANVARELSISHRDTGNYMASFRVFPDLVEDFDLRAKHRAAGVLENTASYAEWVETGHQDDLTGASVEGQHILSRTLERMEQGID